MQLVIAWLLIAQSVLGFPAIQGVFVAGLTL
jgi:hypothetical protein